MRLNLLLPIFLFLITGCFTTALSGRREESLKKTASLYYTLIMWKHFKRANAFVHEEKRRQFDRFTSRIKDKLNITSYQIKDIVFEDNKRSKVKVVLSYYKYPSVSEKTVFLEDIWIFEKGNWFIYSDFEDEVFR
ncbi:hypothetical protein HRbin37_01101 [bacterium HR37]|nr:hypothetical protein HRbin37_01101 [bacterium HR37]